VVLKWRNIVESWGSGKQFLRKNMVRPRPECFRSM